MDRITAPYGFVPLSEKVVCPEWVQPTGENLVAPPLHDVPFRDGICGTLEIEIEAETPIFTAAAEQDKAKSDSFFRLPDKRYALPGSLLRGAFRNVVEIATFGRLVERVNDHRYAVRDLQNRALYGNYMADIVRDPRTGKQEPMPLVNAGWLVRQAGEDGERYTIEVCDLAKIEYLKLEQIAAGRGVRFRPGQKQSAVAKYEAWGNTSREVKVGVQFQRPDRVGIRVMPSRYGKVDTVPGVATGDLVFTGQPSQWNPDRTGQRRRGNAKHHDFVFLRTQTPRTIEMSKRVFQDFEFAHSDSGQQHNLGRSETPNEEWGYWKEKFERGQRVPVFFLADDDGGGVKCFGLAMMFRLPYKHSIGEAVRNAQRQFASAPGLPLDFADGLFGTVRGDRTSKSVALKGRVAFSHALLDGPEPKPLPAVKVVLGQPKASYYPNYVEQDLAVPGSNPGPSYVTWQDEHGRPRGWKRYRPLTETWQPEPPSGADGRPLSLDKVASVFRPLPKGVRFKGKVHVHNVRPVELGALLWAIELGGDGEARHALGYARPLGYGRCRVSVRASRDLLDVGGGAVDLAACKEAFEEYMGREVNGWRQTDQIRELLALAHPVAPKDARYQRLDPGRRVNEFVEAKKDGLALPAVSVTRRPVAARMAGPVQPAVERPRQDFGQRRGPGPRGAPSPSPAPPVLATRKGWPGKKRGDTLTVCLVELNKKGKWRSKVVGFEAYGTLEGTPPADAAADKEYEVEVIQGSDPRNLNLKWKDP